MNKISRASVLMLFLALLYSFTLPVNTDKTVTEEGLINWVSWEEAVKRNEKEPRKILIDVYTDWCHWCKVMDKNTFQNKDIAAYVNDNFYAVKFDAEQKEAINWNGQKFEYVSAGKRGVHALAYSLLDGKASYPSVVLMTEKFERIGIFKGYKQVDPMMKALKYAAGEHYKTIDYSEYAPK